MIFSEKRKKQKKTKNNIKVTKKRIYKYKQ